MQPLDPSIKYSFDMLKYLIALLLPMSVSGQQDIKDYVRNSTVAISTIDPDSTDFGDLTAIGRAIGDARVVFLGEQDHGDAPTFLAKTRIIKYLHEQLGFDVLAFESDFYGLNAGWDALEKTGDSIRSFIRGNIFGVWTSCSSCEQLLYRYVPATWQTVRPMAITGFDNQLVLGFSYRNLFRKLDSVVRYYQLPITREPRYLTELLPLMTSLYDRPFSGADTSLYNKRDACLLKIREQLATKVAPDDLWLMVMDNLVQLNLGYKYKPDYWRSTNIRDKQMARNLRWLCETKFPGKKIIVWAANYHLSKYNGHYPEDFLNNATTMGGTFTADTTWNNRSYILGFTSCQGEAGRVFQKKYNVPKPNSNSLENWIDPRLDLAFTDFKGFNAASPDTHAFFFMSGSVKGNGLHTHHKAEWNRIFDGVFFIRNMYACQTSGN
jgi:erythromycin esterase-like protein